MNERNIKQWLREGSGAARRGKERLRLTLSYQPPLAWDGLLGFLAPRATAGVECVRENSYFRTVAFGKHRGWLRVHLEAGRPELAVELDAALSPILRRAASDGRVELVPCADPEAAMARLRELPGIGDWTAQYIAMRALRWPDAFPAGDLGLLRAWEAESPRQLREAAEAWRPWRGYAAMYLWSSLRAI